MKMDIEFSGGLQVDARFKDQIVRTDQPAYAGGGGTAAAPFDLFLASIGTCAGFYAKQFCTQREIDTEDLKVRLVAERDPERRRIGKIRIEIDLPSGFPEKYKAAIRRSVDQCAVKRHILEPPEFEVDVVMGASVSAQSEPVTV
jgi:putative redox protein